MQKKHKTATKSTFGMLERPQIPQALNCCVNLPLTVIGPVLLPVKEPRVQHRPSVIEESRRWIWRGLLRFLLQTAAFQEPTSGSSLGSGAPNFYFTWLSEIWLNNTEQQNKRVRRGIRWAILNLELSSDSLIRSAPCGRRRLMKNIHQVCLTQMGSWPNLSIVFCRRLISSPHLTNVFCPVHQSGCMVLRLFIVMHQKSCACALTSLPAVQIFSQDRHSLRLTKLCRIY